MSNNVQSSNTKHTEIEFHSNVSQHVLVNNLETILQNNAKIYAQMDSMQIQPVGIVSQNAPMENMPTKLIVHV